MKFKVPLLIGMSFIIGIAIAIAFLASTPNLRASIWGVDTIYAPTATPATGIEYLLDIDLDDENVTYRASMSRNDMERYDFYVADYTETIEWLEDIYGRGNISREIISDFSRIDEVVTMDNLESLYEEPNSPVNNMLGLVYLHLASTFNDYTKADAEAGVTSVSACLALQRDLEIGRHVLLYLRVPHVEDPDMSDGIHVDSRRIAEIPDTWVEIQFPSPETEDWKSECFDDVHFAEMDFGNPYDLEIAAAQLNPNPTPTGDDSSLSTDPDVIIGSISDGNPYVEYPVEVFVDGSTIVIDMAKQDGNLDTLLYLVDSQNNIVAENDDRVRGNTDSLLVFPQAASGVYRAIATRYKVEEGRSAGNFQIQIGVNPPTEIVEQVYAVSDTELTAAGFPTMDPRPQTTWTVLAYYGGDTNLEPGILNDFDEFELGLSESDASVQIIALVDRHPEFTDVDGDWSTAQLFEVQPDVTGDHATAFPPTIDTPALADLGELNTGDGETLAQFLVWGMRHYPADHYVVAFASHGAGWQGLITDDSDNHDILSVPELRRAFATVRDEMAMDEFDLLINDACLMSSTEYYAGISEFFNYSIASPEVVVDPALDMTLLTTSLTSPDALADLGTSLVQRYIEVDIQAVGSSDIQYLTYAVTRLDGYDAVTESVNDFAALVNSNPAVFYPVIGQARVNAYTYTRFLGDSTRIDLGDLMRGIKAVARTQELIDAADAVINALDMVRVYGEAGASASLRSSYYNIYFPASSDDFQISYFEESPLTDWAVMLRGYYNSVTPAVWETEDSIAFHAPVAPRITLTGVFPQEGSVLNAFRIGVDVVGRNISHGDSTIDRVMPDGTVVRLIEARLLDFQPSEDGGIEFVNNWDQGYNGKVLNWDVLLPYVSDGTESAFELLIVNEGDDVAFLDGRYREPGSEQWNDVTVAFDTKQKTVQRIISRSEGVDALAAVDIALGSEFQTFENNVTDDGRVVRQEGTIYIWPEGGLTWSWEAAPSGQYNLGMLMTASGGTIGFASTNVTVNNTDVRLDLRGDNAFADLGVTLPRYGEPEWNLWTPQNFNEDFAYRTTPKDDSNDSLALYFLYDGVERNFDEMIEQLATNYGFTFTGESAPATMSDYEGVQIEYTYETADGQTMNGRAFITTQEFNTFTYMFGAETSEDEARIAELYEVFNTGLSLFNPTGVVPSNANATWAYGSYNGFDYSYHPYPVNWANGYQWLNNSDIYADPEITAEYPGTFFGVTVMPVDGRDARTILREVRRDIMGELILETTGETEDGETITTTSTYLPAGDNLLVQANRTLYSAYHQWDALLYSIERDGVPITGRLYVTIYNESAHVFWTEAPTEIAADIMGNYISFIIDGYQVYGEPEPTE